MEIAWNKTNHDQQHGQIRQKILLNNEQFESELISITSDGTV